MKNVYIADIDGTIADNDHRVHFLRSEPKNWKAYEAGVSEDTVIEPVANLLRIFWWRNDHDVIFVSGRGESCRDETVTWLQEVLREDSSGAVDSRLFMRPLKDYRCDTIIKRELLDEVRVTLNSWYGEDGYKILGVFDDRLKVIRMWQEAGLFVFDVNNGRGEF